MQMREKSHVVKPLLGLMRPYTLQILLCVVLVMLFNGPTLSSPGSWKSPWTITSHR